MVAGAVACLVPEVGLGQPVKRHRIAFLSAGSHKSEASDFLKEYLGALGYGENELSIESRYAEGKNERLAGLAHELVRLAPEVIVTGSAAAAIAAKEATSSIPIVTVFIADPVGTGLAASLARPGGNVTGFQTAVGSLAGKWLELLKEIAPSVSRVAFLFSRATASYAEAYLNPFKAAAASLAVEAIAAPVRDISELESVVAAQARAPSGGLIVMPDSFTDVHRAEITSLAARYSLPAVYPRRIFAELGGLLSYGVDQFDNYRRAASYVDRILKGERPSELPVQAPIKFELVINLKAAKALGLDVPVHLQQRADEVIE
jgi:putative ABC transport system substrate-binding protein